MRRAAFNADGRYTVNEIRDNSVGLRVAALRGHNVAVHVLTWGIDSRLLVRVSKDETLEVCFRCHLSALR